MDKAGILKKFTHDSDLKTWCYNRDDLFLNDI